ncbi:MAG: preprotein translocase subunit YajC [Tissierellia bacterium]|nr:preprotein translocase subunit YajC [Tissierellia bacterium]
MVYLTAAAGGAASYSGIIMMLIFIGFFYFIVIRPQKKREKQIKEMRDNLKTGDEVITIGGIYGKIVKIKDEVVTIEVGADKNKMDVTRWAIGSVTNKKDEAKNDKSEKDKNSK